MSTIHYFVIKNKRIINKNHFSILFILIVFLTLSLAGCASHQQDIDVPKASQSLGKSENQVATIIPTQSPTVTPSSTFTQSTKQEEQPLVQSESNTKKVSGNLKVHFIDVGQADCILIQEPSGKTMLIDAGNNADSSLLVNYLKAQGITKLDYVIGTHPHEDHIGSLDIIISTFAIDKILMPKQLSTTQTFKDVLLAIKNKGLSVTTPKVGDTYELGKAQWTILAPTKENYEEANNSSIVMRLTYGNTSFIFTGDAEELSEGEILAGSTMATKNLNSDLLKVGHHGSSTSTSNAFLKAVSPKYAIISVGAGNDYGHPHKQTLDKLATAGVQVFRTDESGTIIATTDGVNITIDKKASAIKENAPPVSVAEKSISSPTPTVPTEKANGSTTYIANKNSKKFHLPTCKSLPAPQNQVIFKNRDEVVSAGYDPCKNCNP